VLFSNIINVSVTNLKGIEIAELKAGEDTAYGLDFIFFQIDEQLHCQVHWCHIHLAQNYFYYLSFPKV